MTRQDLAPICRQAGRQDARHALGLAGEAIAEAYLTQHSLRVIDRRARTRFGEIDLVATDGGEVVFVEVKTRRGTAYGHPEEAVTPAKRRHLRMAAQAYTDASGVRAPWRIDVVAITIRRGTDPDILWIRDAVGGE